MTCWHHTAIRWGHSLCVPDQTRHRRAAPTLCDSRLRDGKIAGVRLASSRCPTTLPATHLISTLVPICLREMCWHHTAQPPTTNRADTPATIDNTTCRCAYERYNAGITLPTCRQPVGRFAPGYKLPTRDMLAPYCPPADNKPRRYACDYRQYIVPMCLREMTMLPADSKMPENPP
jgi:hypothetical protein